VDEKVTISNPTSFTIDVSVRSSSPNGKERKIKFGPIKPNAKGSGVIPVWPDSSMTVLAHWKTKEGKEITSRPFTATFKPGVPITPLTLTLNIPYSSGDFGVWQSVVWEEPKKSKD